MRLSTFTRGAAIAGALYTGVGCSSGGNPATIERIDPITSGIPCVPYLDYVDGVANVNVAPEEGQNPQAFYARLAEHLPATTDGAIVGLVACSERFQIEELIVTNPLDYDPPRIAVNGPSEDGTIVAADCVLTGLSGIIQQGSNEFIPQIVDGRQIIEALCVMSGKSGLDFKNPNDVI